MALWRNSRYLDVNDKIIAIDPKSKTQKTTLGIRLIDRNLPEEKTLHIIRDKESLLSIAVDYYGDARLWHKIADINPQISDPYDLKIGAEIFIPNLNLR